MNRTSTLDSSCIAFVNELGSMKTTTSFQRGQSGQELYTIRYNGYIKIDNYVKKLKDQLRSFCNELLKLPLVFPDCLSRKTFFLNLYQKLLEVETKIQGLYRLLCKKHPLKSQLKCSVRSFKESKGKEYNEKLFSSRKQYQNHKAHKMFECQKQCLEKALVEMRKLAVAENIDLTENIHLTKEVIKENVEEINRKYRTNLSVAQLSHAFHLFFESVCDDNLNKKDLAELIANNFETSKTKSPSKNQVYKKFFEVDDSAKEPVKKLVIEMLNKANKN